MSSQLEKNIQKDILQFVGGDLSTYTQGLCLQVVEKGRLKVDLKLGNTYRFYDLASLTKILFTVPALMNLWDEKRFYLDQPISEILNWWKPKSVTVGKILSHSAGLPWWAPFYKIKNIKQREVLRRQLEKVKPQKFAKAVYSDLDFILLGFVLEELCGQDLLSVWQQMEWVDKSHLHFCVNNEPVYKRNYYAPTEKCPWRGKVLRGEVHDDNTWSFGGVSTHAGLFGTIDDVSYYGILLRNAYNSKTTSLASSKAVRLFSKRVVPRSQGDWGYGYMLPTKGSASCGRFFSAPSFGHTGFTGTSFWYDPKKDLFVSLLSNRVYPTRENKKFLELRPAVHDIICRNLQK